MRLIDRLRRAFLRWNRLGLAGVMTLPFAVAAFLGFVWLFERGLLWQFAMACVGLAVLVWALRLWLDWRSLAGAQTDPETEGGDGAERVRKGRPGSRPQLAHDPDWSETERAAYVAACARIEKRLKQPFDWEDTAAEALAVVEHVAAEMSGGKRGALDFTVPEALLLIDRVALRYRDFLRSHVPFSDQLSVKALYWLWQRQDTARAAWETGYLAWRGVRMALNPAVGVLREVERAITAGLQGRLGQHVLRDTQVILLEEVAQAAVELYSGRLKFSDAELFEIRLGSELRDQQRLARPDDPVRILVVGQISAGKSTLINALLGDPAAETDMAATTAQLSAHETEFDGTPCRLVDTAGLDGSEQMTKTLAAEMADADLILWVLRASRPSRAPDHALQAAFDARLASQPARRAPPMVLVASAADTLLPDWPYPEHQLPVPAQERLGKAMAAISDDMNGRTPIPVCAEQPAWNIDTVARALGAAMTEALMTQRNRRRLGDGRDGLALRDNLRRAARGARAGAGLLRGAFTARAEEPGKAPDDPGSGKSS